MTFPPPKPVTAPMAQCAKIMVGSVPAWQLPMALSTSPDDSATSAPSSTTSLLRDALVHT